MFYRRKIILALLQLLNGKVDKISLQKLLFLFTIRQSKSIYDFIPYKYGSFSYSANADLLTMVNKGYLTESPSCYKSLVTKDYFSELTIDDKEDLSDVVETYGKMTAESLMKLTYRDFPYWAINSVKAQSILTNNEYQKVLKNKPFSNKTILFTIGYEGISLEEYLNRLIKNDVKVLVDVRRNPLSMKYGFSKSRLKKCCNSVGIKYMHFPEVGIHSQQRQELNDQKDYDALFSIYRKEQLLQTIETQKEIYNLLIENKRIALTCFEADICQCHRKSLSESIQSFANFELPLKHI